MAVFRTETALISADPCEGGGYSLVVHTIVYVNLQELLGGPTLDGWVPVAQDSYTLPCKSIPKPSKKSRRAAEAFLKELQEGNNGGNQVASRHLPHFQFETTVSNFKKCDDFVHNGGFSVTVHTIAYMVVGENRIPVAQASHTIPCDTVPRPANGKKEDKGNCGCHSFMPELWSLVGS